MSSIHSGWRLASLFVVSLTTVAPAQLQSVSTITVEAPATIVRATVPLDPGRPWNPQTCPFTVLAPGGAPCPTQWERVTTWPGTNDVRVAEILAEVPQGTGQQVYQVTTVPCSDRDIVTFSWARNWLSAPPPIRIDGAPVPMQFDARRPRDGRVATTRRFYGPHVVGWVTGYARLDVVELILIAHDGEPHSPTWYFDSLEIDGVGGFASFAPEALVSANGGRLTLVPGRNDGKKNWIEQRGWRRWHLVLHDGTQTAAAVRIAAAGGWGVSDRWTDIGAYQPHALPLPELPAPRLQQLAAECSYDWHAIRDALVAGTPFGMNASWQDGAGRLGFRHAWGPFYGGLTGGGYRHQWVGLETALTGAPEGLLELDARFRMVADRQAVIACDALGDPLVMEDWLDSSGHPLGGWSVSGTNANFDDDGGNAGLGWSTAVSTISPNRIPPEKAILDQYMPMDWQHHDRAHQLAVALAWLNHDPSAEWALHNYAELWRWRERSRLGESLDRARDLPGRGTEYGRDAGHLYTAAAAAYALAGPVWRARWDPWLRDYADLVTLSQMPNGLWQQRAFRKEAKQPPFGDGVHPFWAIAKGTEEALMSGSVAALAGSVPGLHAQLAPVIRRHAVDGLWGFLWGSGATGMSPTDFIAVRPVAYSSSGPQLGRPQLDPGSVPKSGFDKEEIGAALGYAAWCDLQLSGAVGVDLRPVITRYCQGALDPIAWWDSQNLGNLRLDDIAPLYSALD